MSIKIYLIRDPVEGKEKPVRFEGCEFCGQELPADNVDYWRLIQPGLPNDTTCFQVCVNCHNKSNKERPKP